MSQFVLSNLTFDFGQGRAGASIQSSDGAKFYYLNLSVSIDTPADISAKELEDYILKEIRNAVSLAANFTYKKPDDGTS